MQQCIDIRTHIECEARQNSASSSANAGTTAQRHAAAVDQQAQLDNLSEPTPSQQTPNAALRSAQLAIMVKKKAKSHRQTLKQKYKVQKRVKEHDRKLKKAQKRGGLPPGKKKRDPGIPNGWPIKQELLEQVERAKAKKEQDREDAKQAKKERRKLAKQGLSMEQLAASAKEFGAPRSTIRGRCACATAGGRSGTKLPSEAPRHMREGRAKVVEASDVVLEVLDARDPAGSRSSRVESAVRRARANV